MDKEGGGSNPPNQTNKPDKKWQLEEDDPEPEKKNTMGFERTIRELKMDGCREEDIIGLLQQFAKNEQSITFTFNNMAVTEDKLQNTAAADYAAPDKNNVEAKPNNETQISKRKLLKLTDLSKLMTKIEDIVDTELGTLRNHILQNTSARKQQMSLSELKEHVHNWAVEVWRDRMPEDQINMPSEDQKSKGKQSHKSKKGLKKDKDITIDDQNTTNGKQPPSPTVKSPKKLPLTEEQKSKKYTNRLLLFKLEMYKSQIEKLLDQYVQNKMFQNIDCKRYFDDLFESFQFLVKISICKDSDLKRQFKKQTDPACYRQLKEFFMAAFKDKNGQSFFYKYEFYEGLKKFFQEQENIFKATKVLTGDTVIVIDTNGEFEQYLQDGIPIQINEPIEKEHEVVQDELELIDQLIDNLERNIENSEKLLQSNQVKDFNRKENILFMINQFKLQIKELEKKKPVDPLIELLQKQNNSTLKNSFITPSRAAYLKQIAGIDSSRTANDSAFRTLKKIKKSKQKETLTKEEQIESSLKETFDFYARQHIANNQGFDEMKDGLKKIDLGEFNGFLRDFKINLPREKTNALFLKAGQNIKEIELNNFREAIILVGQEYAKAKLRENKQRLVEWKKLIEDLRIPETYPNTAGTLEFRKKILETLEKKTTRFSKYVDNNLRQRMMMTDQMPLARGKLTIKKKETTIAGNKLVHKVDNPDDELRKPQQQQHKDKTDNKAENNPKNQQEDKNANQSPSKAKPDKNDNNKEKEKNKYELPDDDNGDKQNDNEDQQKDNDTQQNKKVKKNSIDPYLIKLDKMDKLDLPPNEMKVRLKKRIALLQSQIEQMKQAQVQRKKKREEQQIKKDEKLQKQQDKIKMKEEQKAKKKEEKAKKKEEQKAKMKEDKLNEKEQLKENDKAKDKIEDNQEDNNDDNQKDEQNEKEAQQKDEKDENENKDEEKQDQKQEDKDKQDNENNDQDHDNDDEDEDNDQDEDDDQEDDDDDEGDEDDVEYDVEGITDDEVELIEEYTLKIQDLEDQLEQPDEQIQHPMHYSLEKIESDIKDLEQVIKEKCFDKFALEDLFQFHIKDAYRAKIKGFHLAFNVKEKLEDNPKSKYQFQNNQSAEELRLAALDRKNQRLYRKQLIEQEKEEKNRKDRLKMRLIAEQSRAYKHEELLRLQREIYLENHRLPPSTKHDVDVAKMLLDDHSTSPIAYLSDPKNYQAIRDKQLSLDRTRIHQKSTNRAIQQSEHQKEFDKKKIEEQRVRQVEDIVTKPGVTFDDLEKLDYGDINAISKKYGEDSFDPKALLDFDENESDASEDNEILRKYKNKNNGQQTQSKGPQSVPNPYQYSANTPNVLNSRKYSKPSIQSQIDSNSAANYNINAYRAHDRTAGSQDLSQLYGIQNQASYDGSLAKIGMFTSAPDIAASPMYSPANRLNLKKNFQDQDLNKVMADHTIQRQYTDDMTNMQVMSAPRTYGQQSQNPHQNNNLYNKLNIKNNRNNSNIRNPNMRQQDTQSVKHQSKHSNIGRDDLNLKTNQKPQSYRGGYPGNSYQTINTSPSYQSLGQQQPYNNINQMQPMNGNMLALPSPFDNTSAQKSKNLPPQYPLNTNQRNRSNIRNGSINGSNGPSTLDYGNFKNKKHSNTEDIQSQYSMISANQMSNRQGNQNTISHMKNQSLIRAQQLQQIQNDKNSKQKMQMDVLLKQQDRNIRKGIKAAQK